MEALGRVIVETNEVDRIARWRFLNTKTYDIPKKRLRKGLDNGRVNYLPTYFPFIPGGRLALLDRVVQC